MVGGARTAAGGRAAQAGGQNRHGRARHCWAEIDVVRGGAGLRWWEAVRWAVPDLQREAGRLELACKAGAA
jgi:hypothetical protein